MNVTTLAEVIQRAARGASLAPSVHNTQPWRLAIADRTLELHADPARQLHVLDPTGRQLMISCGAALFNARAVLAAEGYDAIVLRQPDPEQPDLVARIVVPDDRGEWLPISKLAAMIELRHTNRRNFDADEPVPADTVSTLRQAAAAEDAELYVVSGPEQGAVVAALSQQADALQHANAAYRAELRAWTSDDPRRRDGVLAMSTPYRSEASDAEVAVHGVDDVPVRDFDTTAMGWLPTDTRSTTDQCLLLLGTTSDNPASWIRAGEALERVWLAATAADCVASPLTQVVEIAATRLRLRADLGLQMYPHILLRVGRAPRTFPAQRRDLEDLLIESEETS